MNPTESSQLELRIFRGLLAVVLVVALLRIGVWLGYEIFEWRRGSIVLHEEIDEFLILITMELILIPILIFLLIQVTRKVTSPVQKIARSSGQILQGQLDARIDAESLPEGELRQVGSVLNAAFDRYAEVNARMARFTGDASHQLRTPLTTIQNTAELALVEGKIGPACQSAMESILQECQRLTRLCETLLKMSRFDSGQVTTRMKRVELASVLTRCVDTYAQVAEAQGVDLVVDLPPNPPVVRADDVLLFELFANLMDNAIKACVAGDTTGEDPSAFTDEVEHRIVCPAGPFTRREPSSTFRIIRVSMLDGDVPCVKIEDSGPGIADELRERLFERFSRGPTASWDGDGLGLALCEEICRLHGATIWIGDSDLGGAELMVQFPDNRAAQSMG